MALQYAFTVQKHDKGYRLVAPQYGLVHWTSDLATGTKEFESRIETVGQQLREAGFDLDEINMEPTKRDQQPSVLLWPFFVKAIAVAAIAAIVFIPISNSLSRAFGPQSAISEAVRHPSKLIVQMGEKADQVPPQRVEEVKAAVRKLVSKFGPVVEELHPLIAAPPSR